MSTRVRARGQSLAEYAILLGIVAAAAVTMQVYARRGLQAGLKAAADQLGDQAVGLQQETGKKVRLQESAIKVERDHRRQIQERLGGGVQVQTAEHTRTRGALEGCGADPCGPETTQYTEVVTEPQPN